MPDTTPAADRSPPDRTATDPDASAGSDSDAEGPPFACRYCDRQFHRPSYLALHHGQEHESELTTAEREAVTTAREEEVEQLRLFRLQALAALVFIYFGFLLVYAFSL